MKITRVCRARAFAAALALLLAASCAPGRGAGPGAAAAGAAPTVAALLFADDGPGQLAAAERLCTPIAAVEQREAGLRSAEAAFEDLALAAPERRARAALSLCRCAALRADGETDAARVRALTQRGIDAAAAAGGSAEPRAAYCLALNLGMQLRLLGLEAMARLPELQQALAAAAAAPEEDQGGALRVLGMLYLRAPAWPAGPGDPEAALRLLRETAQRFPSHPQNHLFLAQALALNDEPEQAARELALAAALARPELWGESAGRWQAEIRALQSQWAP
jgi:hypothetical protein